MRVEEQYTGELKRIDCKRIQTTVPANRHLEIERERERYRWRWKDRKRMREEREREGERMRRETERREALCSHITI